MEKDVRYVVVRLGSQNKEDSKYQNEILIVDYHADDWFRDYSPWYMKTDDRVFEGKGDSTLEKIALLADELKKEYLDAYFILAGYSLAALTVLWEAYERGMFDGYVVASASLWFIDWMDYVKSNFIKKPSTIYLSLGGKESKTKDVYMATVMDCYEEQHRLLKKDKNVIKTVFVKNPGGHFSNTQKRVDDGIDWIIEENEKNRK